VNDRLDQLQHLAVINARLATFPDVFVSAPQLREVFLTGWDPILLPQVLPFVPIPWGQITHRTSVTLPTLCV